MKNFKKIFLLNAIAGLSLVLFFSCLPLGKVLAVNDVQINSNTNFQLNTFDTAALTTIVASSSGQVTNIDVQSNYIDITLDNLSSVTFTTTVGGQYLNIAKQSGSNDYTVSPSCPTSTATLTGTGATVILRLKVITTDLCPAGGALDHFAFNPISNQTASVPFSITIIAQDSSNNTVTSYVGTNTLSDSTGTISPASTGNFTSGVWTGNVTITKGQTGITISTLGASKTGTSNAFNVESGAGGTNLLLLDPKFWTLISPTPPVCADYMTKYISLGADNDPAEVIKLQKFLRDYEGFSALHVAGIYDAATYNDVKQFQAKYASNILAPWGFTEPTGMVNRTTVKKINEIYCSATQAASAAVSSQQALIDQLKQKIADLQAQIALLLANQKPATQPIEIFTQTIVYESQGSQVILLQDTLKKLGFFPQSVDSTGYFGSVTLKAVQDFQVKYNIAQSGVAGYGIVGPKTRQALNQLINQ
jgi:N-acetylmuramoyl-L-alanine amidase